jgi:hypothetical protein
MKKTKISTIRSVFFPLNFEEKYQYLGKIPSEENKDLFRSIYPLVLAMDYEAKPNWCPRWFLRFLHNFTNNKLKVRLTNGISIGKCIADWDYYKLQISVSGPIHIHKLTEAIEEKFYLNEYRLELINRIKKLDPDSNVSWESLDALEDIWKRLRKEHSLNKYTDLPKQ